MNGIERSFCPLCYSDYLLEDGAHAWGWGSFLETAGLRVSAEVSENFIRMAGESHIGMSSEKHGLCLEGDPLVVSGRRQTNRDRFGLTQSGRAFVD